MEIPVLRHDIPPLADVINYQPAICIMMPFEPKMMLKSELEHQLKLACREVEMQLQEKYTGEQTQAVLEKLQVLIKSIDYSTYKRSIAIFVSLLVQKVYYLEIPVEEKIIINESFEIRDLVYNKKEMPKYLVLVLSSGRSRVFLGNNSSFIRVASNMPEHSAAYAEPASPKEVHPSYRKEVLLEKFLRHIDNGLSIILRAYSLPLFVMGAGETLEQFRKITRHLECITGYVYGNFEEAGDKAIQHAIAPQVADWKKVKQNDLMMKLDAAMSAHKLAAGIQDVWKGAARRKGRLLIVEKNYICSIRYGAGDNSMNEPDCAVADHALHIKDAVDDVIEKVLENGGDVEFVDEGILNGYGRIALIDHY